MTGMRLPVTGIEVLVTGTSFIMIGTCLLVTGTSFIKTGMPFITIGTCLPATTIDLPVTARWLLVEKIPLFATCDGSLLTAIELPVIGRDRLLGFSWRPSHG
jgi:hypothetical protein